MLRRSTGHWQALNKQQQQQPMWSIATLRWQENREGFQPAVEVKQSLAHKTHQLNGMYGN